MATEQHDRAYLQARLQEEIARASRHQTRFALILFEQTPSGDGLAIGQKMEYGLQALSSALRGCDVVGQVFEDTVAVLLIDTTRRQVGDALLRMRARLARHAGTWHITEYHFPEHAAALEVLPLLTAA
ncbi:MAG: GGDEF domain-containing protein [Chloroflexota bacterium]|nr:GGDEF domain-containing protein [Chloroflexota bacterium]